ASGTITYVDPKTTSNTLIDKKDISTDGIVLVNGLSGLSSSVLANAKLSIAPKSITANQIADNTITSDKIKVDAGAVTGMIPIVGASGTITYVDPKTTSNTLIDKKDISTDGIVLVNGLSGLSSSVL
ncbi:hypothetical protein, partial [Pedobacter nototheniae]|uniref:hypothetical protein n=2 Tax=Pedobacter nototheniae TaxID=2488994 RepID=UPI001B8BE6D4